MSTEDVHTEPLGLMVLDKKIFFSFSYKLPWQPEFWMEWNFFNNNERSSHKDHFCKVCLQLAMWCRKRCCLKKCGQTDGRLAKMGSGTISFIFFCLIEGHWPLNIILLWNELYYSLLFCLQLDGPLSHFGGTDRRQAMDR